MVDSPSSIEVKQLDADFTVSEHKLKYAQLRCPSCWITCYVPEGWLLARRENHQTLWCPNGHAQVASKGE